jgi:acetylornithine deacetylase
MRRDPNIPVGDALALTRALVAIDSRNPSLASDGPGEGPIAEFLADVLRRWGFQVDLFEALPGRPNVVARIAGGNAGYSLLLNGHLDTVGVEGMTHAPHDPVDRDGRLYGRGSCDMKAGIAAMCAAAVRAAKSDLGGEIIVTAVADEEFASAGTRVILDAGITAHAAIVTEPTRLTIAPAHRGFAWCDVVVHGRAAHGSRYELGVDAVAHAGLLLAELHAHDATTLRAKQHPLLGSASMHAGTIHGGNGISTYPERCEFSLERRTLPGERGASFLDEVREAAARVKARVPNFHAEFKLGLVQEPNDVAVDHRIVQALGAAAKDAGVSAPIAGLSCWTDAALLTAKGIPAVCFGPGDIALAHAAEEYVPVAEIEQATDVLTRTIIAWCGPKGVAWGS